MNREFRALMAATVLCALPLESSTAGEANVAAATANNFRVDPMPIEWSYLAPKNGKPFNDPFARLTSDQLADLSYIVRVQRLVAEEEIDADGDDAKTAAKLSRKLSNDGVDIGWLLMQRRRVQQIRGLQVERLSHSIAESLSHTKVTLTGYLIPITVNQGKLTEFFLVPTIAACSHEAAPPRLQVVFVSPEQGFAPPDKAIPVRVTGTVKAETTTHKTVNGDGEKIVRSAYTMLSPRVEIFDQSQRLPSTLTP